MTPILLFQYLFALALGLIPLTLSALLSFFSVALVRGWLKQFKEPDGRNR